MKTTLAVLAAAACLGALPASAEEFSFDPLKDLESALPKEAPNEPAIIRARQQVREMAQDALSTLYEIAPGTRRAIDRSAGYAVFSTFGLKLFFAGGTTGKGVASTNAPTARRS